MIDEGYSLFHHLFQRLKEQGLTHYVNYVGKVSGFPIKVKSAIYSSDGILFSYEGIPTISFACFDVLGSSAGHHR